jgi:hypothetical protein
MRNKSLCAEDRETVINKTDADKEWGIYSCNAAMVRRLRRIASKMGVSVTEKGWGGIEVSLPVSCVRIVALRHASDAQKRNGEVQGRRLSEAKRIKAGSP